MELGLSGRTALVCASTAGLGLAIASTLAYEGANVVISGRRADVADRVAESLPSAVGVGVDLSEPGAPARLVEAAQRRFGAIDVLVLNSGGPPPGGALQQTRESLQGAIERLLLPQHELISMVVPGMVERGWGRVLAVGSSGVAEPLAGLAASNAGRGALAGLLKTLAGEVAAHGVTVNMLLPGRIDTDRVRQLDQGAAEREGRDVEQVRAEALARIPARRYGEPDEFGTVAAFLCSDKASYVTGTHIRVDGGLVRGF